MESVFFARLVFFFILYLFSENCHAHKYYSPFDFLNYERATVKLDPSVKLTTSRSVLQNSGDWLTLTWKGVRDPSFSDWIALYPSIMGDATINPTKQAPVKFQYCNKSASHLQFGEGSLKFRLVNLRVPYIFGLLRGGLHEPSVIAVSNEVNFVNFNAPLQGHLSMTDIPTEMMLTWVSGHVSNPMAKLWQNLTTYVRIESATTTTYSSTDMCGPPATSFGYIDPGLIHTVIFKGLTPGHAYNYQFGDDIGGWSSVFSFKVPLLPGANSSISILAFGDMGQGPLDDTNQFISSQPPSLNTTRLMMSELHARDLILHIGDISYARGYAGVWDEFFDQIEPLATLVPYMVCVGNHERDYPNSGSMYNVTDSGGECGIPYQKRFPMPRSAPDQHWYGFSIGSIHIVIMSTELDFSIGSVQYNWLKDHLAAVNRSVTPWLIFTGHRPMYVDSSFGGSFASDLVVSTLLQDNIEDLLKLFNVDLVLWGHHHSYQRTCPVYRKECVQGAPVHVVIGMAGQSLSQDIQKETPEWVEYLDIEHYGYTRITATSKTFKIDYVRDDDGKVHDSYEISK